MKQNTSRIVIIILAIILVLIALGIAAVVSLVVQQNGEEFKALYGALVFPGLGLMILIAIWSYLEKSDSDDRRSKTLSIFAAQNSLSYQKTMDLAFLAGLDSELNDNTFRTYFTPLCAESKNVISGRIGNRNFLVSDQHYADTRYSRGAGGGRGLTQYYSDTIVAIEIPEANLPFFFLYPQNTYDSIANAVGQFDINFPTHPNFSQKFVLRGTNEPHIRWLFNERILTFYEQPLPFTTTIGGGKYLLIYRNGLLQPHEILPQIQMTEVLARLFISNGI